MRDMQALVKKFHEKHSLPINIGFDTHNLLVRQAYISEESGELAKAIMEDNIPEVVDALADLLYFILGTGVVLGIDLEEIFVKVHEENMKKPLVKSKAGKVLHK